MVRLVTPPARQKRFQTGSTRKLPCHVAGHFVLEVPAKSVRECCCRCRFLAVSSWRVIFTPQLLSHRREGHVTEGALFRKTPVGDVENTIFVTKTCHSGKIKPVSSLQEMAYNSNTCYEQVVLNHLKGPWKEKKMFFINSLVKTQLSKTNFFRTILTAQDAI